MRYEAHLNYLIKSKTKRMILVIKKVKIVINCVENSAIENW